MMWHNVLGRSPMSKGHVSHTCNSSQYLLQQNNSNSRNRIVLVREQTKELIVKKMRVKTGYTKIATVGAILLLQQ